MAMSATPPPTRALLAATIALGLALLAGCGDDGDGDDRTLPATASSAPTTTADGDAGVPPDAVAVTVTSAEIQTEDGRPVLVLSGDAPTPCHDVVHEVTTSDDAVAVTLGAVPPPEGISCAQVIEPFDRRIALPQVSRPTPVTVDGAAVGQVGG